MTERLKIGSLTYEVRYPHSVEVDGERASASLDYDAQAIHVQRSLTTRNKWISKWHEATHAILAQSGFIAEAENETLVSAISNGICQVLTDNEQMRSSR